MAKLIKKSVSKSDVHNPEYFQLLHKIKGIITKQYKENIAMVNVEMGKQIIKKSNL